MNKNSRPTLNRREALASLGLLAAATHSGFSVAKEGTPGKPKLAMQLYTMRDPAKKDLKDTLKKVREIGYEYVQWSGMPGMPFDQILAALDEAGLKAMACHCGVEPFETDFENYSNSWKSIGAVNVGPGGMMGDCRDTLKDWLRGVKRLDAVGAKLSAKGMRLTYHNHASEFEKYPDDPRTKEDILLQESDPKNLFAELDVAWAHIGGVDPAAFLRANKGRCPTIHAKDVAPAKAKSKFTPLGQGILDWDDLVAAGIETGVEWFIYEQDNGVGSPFDWAAESFEFMSKKLA
jgi:sugar phosphate isomerase/epimerase